MDSIKSRFGDNTSKSAIIVKELYGMKRAGASFRTNLEQHVSAFGYHSCKVNPDLWIKSFNARRKV